MIVYAFNDMDRTAYRCNLSLAQARKYDNGHLISIGLEIGKDITPKQLQRFHRVEVSWDDWKHSGCQSRCVRRGDDICQW